ncbi:MAG: membrane protein of unknown function [Promethearchaeota archaeon]|nr:MAG: membrane protein of unknown function [Candidatus Lokiarchaeota archaeon]
MGGTGNIINWFMALEIFEIIIIVVAFIIITLIIETIFLYMALKVANARNTDFGDVFVTALVMALVGWIPILGCILHWIIISSRHDTGFITAIGVWIFAGLLPIIVAIFVIALVLLPILAVSLPAAIF